MGAPTDAERFAPVAFLDVHYTGDAGDAACIVAARWTDAAAIEERVEHIGRVAPYRPGAFYERELPCLRRVLARVTVAPAAIVVDGYVALDERGTPGLGAHLHAELGGAVPVVGVAKTSFRGSSFARRVTRGRSTSPLFVTALGIEVEQAADLVRAMHGPYRIPTLLARVDRLARGATSAPPR